MLFDSLSTLLIYNNKETVTKFTRTIIGKLKKAGMGGIFTALKGDTEKGLLKEMGMFVDEVVTYQSD